MTQRPGVCALLVFAVAGLGQACTKVSSDPTIVVALAFDSLPYPAVIAGDTLRDESGAATPLRATALNSDGESVTGAPTTFVILGKGATATPEGFIVSTDATVPSLSVVAQTAGLQSRPLIIVVTPRPDSVAKDGTLDTLRYALPDVSTNVSGSVSVRVLSNQTATAAGVGGWIVRYTVEYNGAPLPANDTQQAWLLDDASRRSTEDTTSADGRASRKLRVNPDHIPGLVTAESVDSVIVFAKVERAGVPLAGSPLRFVVVLKAKGGS